MKNQSVPRCDIKCVTYTTLLTHLFMRHEIPKEQQLKCSSPFVSLFHYVLLSLFNTDVQMKCYIKITWSVQVKKNKARTIVQIHIYRFTEYTAPFWQQKVTSELVIRKLHHSLFNLEVTSLLQNMVRYFHLWRNKFLNTWKKKRTKDVLIQTLLQFEDSETFDFCSEIYWKF